MTIQARYTVKCDIPGCTQRLVAKASLRNVRDKARRDGWSLGGWDLCPEHIRKRGHHTELTHSMSTKRTRVECLSCKVDLGSYVDIEGALAADAHHRREAKP